MTGRRTEMLAAVRAALGRDRLPEAAAAVLQRRLSEPRSNIVPMRGQPSPAERIERFIFEAERVQATVVRLAGLDEVPNAVATYLRTANMPSVVRIGDDEVMQAVPWGSEPLLETATGAAVETDTASVTSAFAGVAETGTLILLSGPKSPTTLNFLPEAHLVVLPSERVVGSYEEAWQRLRGKLGNGRMPRVVNWITGPSRTADIEQTLLLGAHGPKRLQIMLVDGECPQ